MKELRLKRIFLPAIALMLAASAPAQTSTPPTNAAQSQARRLPYGVEDVLKLSRSGVGEDVILNYVETSGTVYNLSPDDIVYLKTEGLSERVINKMLEQRRLAIQQAEKPTTLQSAPGTETASAQSQPQNPPSQPPPGYTPPAYSQAPVVVEQPSTVQVAPYPYYYSYPYPYYYRYPYYGWYRPYYGYYGGWWGAPALSFGFRFGGGHHWHHH